MIVNNVYGLKHYNKQSFELKNEKYGLPSIITIFILPLLLLWIKKQVKWHPIGVGLKWLSTKFMDQNNTINYSYDHDENHDTYIIVITTSLLATFNKELSIQFVKSKRNLKTGNFISNILHKPKSCLPDYNNKQMKSMFYSIITYIRGKE